MNIDPSALLIPDAVSRPILIKFLEKSRLLVSVVIPVISTLLAVRACPTLT